MSRRPSEAGPPSPLREVVRDPPVNAEATEVCSDAAEQDQEGGEENIINQIVQADFKEPGITRAKIANTAEEREAVDENREALKSHRLAFVKPVLSQVSP